MLSILIAAFFAAAGTVRPEPPSASPEEAEVVTKDELSDDDVRDQVNAYLGSIDTPIRANQWKVLGPRAVPLLEQIVHSDQELPTRRAKAIEGLAALGSPNASTLFTEIAAREHEPVVVRFAAVRGLARVTPPRQAAAALKPILEGAKDSRVRALAAEQLAIRSRGKSCDLVRAQVERESEDSRAHYHRALGRCPKEK